MSGKTRALVFAVAAFASANAAFASGTLLKSEYIKTSGEAELGQWYGYRQYTEGPGPEAFSNTLLRARAARVPMFTIWSSPECHLCSQAADLFNTEAFEKFLSSQKMFFAYFKSGNAWSYTTPADVASIHAFTYIVELGKPYLPPPYQDTTKWPYYRFEWVKPDGTVVTTNGTLSVTPDRVVTLAEFQSLLARLADGYDNEGILDYFGGSVAVEDSATSRLEAEEGVTATVWVPIKRPMSASGIVTNQTVRCFLGGVTNVYPVAWAKGDVKKFVEVAVPAGAAAGEEVVIRIDDADGTPRRSGRIHVVAAQPSSQENPLWIGERTPDGLGWGEWTMDIDVATQKVAAAAAAGTNAYTLVLVGGELWCPDCEGMRANLLSKAVFMDWAKSNNVALVLVDIPRSFATAVPTMLSWGEYGKSVPVSGASYLSRKGIWPELAEAVYARNSALAQETFNPQYENRPRPWVPTLFLLDAGGRICGKLLGDRKYPNNAKYASKITFTVAAYMCRFDELLAMVGDAGESANNDWSTTAEALSAKGGAWSGTFCALDGNTGSEMNQVVVDFAELTGLAENEELELAFSGDAGCRLRPALYIVQEDGGSNIVTSVDGPSFTLSAGGTWTLTNSAPDTARKFLALKGNDDAFFAYNKEGSTVCNYTASATSALLVGEKLSQKAVEVGSLYVKVEEGLLYLIVGVPFGFSAEDFEKVGEGYYRALRSGVAAISVEAPGMLAYQAWNPGRVSFAAAAVSVSERDGEAKVVLRRTGGVSSEAKARVALVGGTAASTADDPENGRFEWDGDKVFTWPDGIATNQALPVKIIDRTPRWDGDQTVVLSVTAEPDSASTVDEPLLCTITIVEADAKSTGRLELAPDPVRFSGECVAYARGGDVLAFDVARVDGAASDVSAEIEVTGGGDVSPASATWKGNSADSVRHFTLTVPGAAEPGSWICARVVPEGIGMKRGVDRMYVKVLAAEAPVFAGEASVVTTLCVATSCDVTAEIAGAGGFAGCRVDRLSGALPEGVVAEVSGGALHFTGVPGAAGARRSSWKVFGVREDGSEVEGGMLFVDFDVVAPGAVCEAAQDAEFPGAQPTYYSGYAADSENGLVCVVSLSADRAGRMRLVVDSLDGRQTLTSGAWSSVDASSMAATLSGGGLSATVSWSRRPDGSCGFGGTLSAGAAVGEVPIVFFRKDVVRQTLDPGVYLVDFEPEGDVVGLGHACASVRVMNPGSYGQYASYTMVLPDGRSFGTSSAILSPGDGYGYLPIMRQTASGTIRSLLRICPGAAGDARFVMEYNHSVSNAFASYLDLPSAGVVLKMCAQGGYYKPGLDLESVCLASDLTTKYTLSTSEEWLYAAFGLTFAEGGLKGMVTVSGDRPALDRISAEDSRAAFHFDRSTGMFSGKFSAFDDSGRKRTVNYRGVIMPNWGPACEAGCGGGARPGPFKPFGVGTAYLNGHKSLSGVLFELSPVQED